MNSIKVIASGIFTAGCMCAGAMPAKVDFNQRARNALDGTVRRAEQRDRQLGVIELFTAAYFFCESGCHLDKLDLLFDMAAEMQDRKPKSRSYGNYRWYFRDGCVMDYNAVDFCMQTGALMAGKHLEKMSAKQRAAFEELIKHSIAGCIAHKVRPGYTNIAIMNAVNLILLGEACNRPDAFDEGVKRLDAFVLHTALFGVCEYSSPTYTAVDVLNLHRLHANVKDAGVKATCEKLLKLFWTDLCASSFPAAGRLGGAHSRDYDYLYGMGGVAPLLRAAGIAPAQKNDHPPIEFLLDDWRPDAETRALSTRAGRFLVSRWGEDSNQVRSYWAGNNIALGIAGANYWDMDVPLAVDFASKERLARGYFIADARRDPYGRKKIPEGTGPHRKTLHLIPFWDGVQSNRDALGLVIYRASDVPPDTPTLESHFVFTSAADEIYVGDELVRVESGKPFAREMTPGTCVFVRCGAGALGVRVPWARDMKGAPAKQAFVWDDAQGVPACRLTVAHHDFWGATPMAEKPAGAAFYVRVCDDAGDAAKFAAFRAAFAAALMKAECEDGRVDVKVCGERDGLVVTAGMPFGSAESFETMPQPAVLAVDGTDVGAKILGDVPGVAEYRAEVARAKREMDANKIVVNAMRSSAWEAEKGVIVPKMAVGKDAGAIGGRYVWLPGAPGERGGGNGSVSWQLNVEQAGTYYLRGRISAATQEDDSFFVSVHAGEIMSDGGRKGAQILSKTSWHLGMTGGLWKWVPLPEPLVLPKGKVVLTVHAREDGAKIDRVFLSSSASEEPR